MMAACARDCTRRQNSAHTLIRELEDVTRRVEGAEDLLLPFQDDVGDVLLKPPAMLGRKRLQLFRDGGRTGGDDQQTDGARKGLIGSRLKKRVDERRSGTAAQ